MTNKTSNLNLEASAGASSASTFELTSLGTDVRLSVGTRHTRGTEMLNGLTGVLLSTKKDSVLSSGSSASQLVESEGLTSSLDDSASSCVGESEGADLQSRELEKTGVVQDGANDNGDAVLALALHLDAQLRDGDRGSVVLVLEMFVFQVNTHLAGGKKKPH